LEYIYLYFVGGGVLCGSRGGVGGLFGFYWRRTWGSVGGVCLPWIRLFRRAALK